MRTLGVLGGMSWESTAEYYRLLNRGVADRLGGLHSARLVMYSADFAGIAELQQVGDWAAAGATLADPRPASSAPVPTPSFSRPARCITWQAHRARGRHSPHSHRPEGVALPAFDTTVLHTAAAVEFSLAGVVAWRHR